MQIILIGIGLYFLYRFVFGFLIPVIKTTRQVKSQFQQMKEQMETAQQQTNGRADYNANGHGTAGAKAFSKNTSTQGAKEDYIDFEEL